MIKRIGLVLIILLLLTACGSATAQGDIEDGPGSGDENSEAEWQQLRAEYSENALSPAMQLVVGTLMLEDTDLAVDAELAKELLPYWKLYLSLLESDTTASEELESLVNNIQQLMTEKQVRYIADLELTQEDLMILISEIGITGAIRTGDFGEGDGTGSNRPEGIPEGMRPGGGQGRGSGADGLDPELMATMQAKREEDGGGFGVNRMIKPLIGELITILERKTSN